MTSTSLRYSRHILLKEFGDHGQKTLASCHILVVGAGGVGSPAALYLAEAGVGTLTIIDYRHGRYFQSSSTNFAYPIPYRHE